MKVKDDNKATPEGRWVLTYLRQGGRIGPIIIAVISVVFAAEAIQRSAGTLTAPGPAMWPLMVCGATFILAVLATIRNDDVPGVIRRAAFSRVTIYILGLAGVVVLYPFLGFIPCSMMFGFVLTKFGAGERWMVSAAISVVCSFAIYAIFGIFLKLPISAFF